MQLRYRPRWMASPDSDSPPGWRRVAPVCQRVQCDAKSNFQFSPSPNNVVFDYTADGVRRSIEDSLQRMGVSRLDIALVTTSRPTTNCCRPSTSRSRAFPALSRMREEGIIKGWGIGVNTPEPILRVMQEGEPDVCMLASQYSLTDHANALNNVFPLARQRNVKFVIGSSLNAGFISGSPRDNYGKTAWGIPAGPLRSGGG